MLPMFLVVHQFLRIKQFEVYVANYKPNIKLALIFVPTTSQTLDEFILVPKYPRGYLCLSYL